MTNNVCTEGRKEEDAHLLVIVVAVLVLAHAEEGLVILCIFVGVFLVIRPTLVWFNLRVKTKVVEIRRKQRLKNMHRRSCVQAGLKMQLSPKNLRRLD